MLDSINATAAQTVTNEGQDATSQPQPSVEEINAATDTLAATKQMGALARMPTSNIDIGFIEPDEIKLLHDDDGEIASGSFTMGGDLYCPPETRWSFTPTAVETWYEPFRDANGQKIEDGWRTKVSTQAEVQSQGGQLTDKWGANAWKRCAQIQGIAFQVDGDDGALLPFTVGDKKANIVTLRVQAPSAWDNCGSKIVKRSLNAVPAATTYAIYSTQLSAGKMNKKYWAPIARPIGATDPKILEWLQGGSK